MKKSFYLKYIEDKENEIRNKKLKKKYKLDDNTIIIERSSNFFIRLLNMSFIGIKSAFKFILYILVMLFISIGVTVIINSNIRQIFLNLIVGGN